MTNPEKICLSHELKNPLYIMKSKIEIHTDALSRGVYKSNKTELEKSREMLQVLEEQVTRAIGIVRENAELFKQLDSEYKKESVSVCSAVNQALKMVLSETRYANVTIHQDRLNGEYAQVNVRHFEEILVNLITNAFHAMEGIPGKLFFSSQKKENGKVLITIQDTGSGISEETRRKIFQPFYTTKSFGTGLGLYITKQLVEKNGGKISVKSEKGKGTTFVLSFEGESFPKSIAS